jgi:DNA-binding NarL/FixJ family response regulator
VVASVPPGGPERERFAQIRDAFPHARIVACMQPARMRVLRWAIDGGADGIVWETELERTLGPTIQAVRAGQLTIPRDAYRRSGTEELTNREKQCLSLVLMGLTNREIAQKLFISESTVKSHLNSSYRKLGVHSRAEAQSLIADPAEGLGTGILAITRPGLARGLTRDPPSRE